MSRTWLKPLSVGLFVVIGLLLAVVPAAAQTPLGAGPDNPMAPLRIGYRSSRVKRGSMASTSVSLC